MHKHHLLILGAGLMQKPAILAAKKLGFYVTVIDGNPNALCIPLADSFENIDLKDYEAIKNFALKLKSEKFLSAIFTAGTDFSMSVSFAAESCNFSAHSYKSAINASNKFEMRNCFKKNNVPSPNFFKVTQDNLDFVCNSTNIFEDFTFPLVVKPVDNMGGRGCKLITKNSELKPALEDALLNSRSKCAIVEDFMEGPEFSIDALVYNGTVTICGFADRHIYFPPYFIEMGHTMPTNISTEQKEDLIATFVQGIHSLGLSCGAAKADIKLTPKGPMIGEIAARLSGGYMSGWTFPYASDFNLTEQAILIACGEEPTELIKNRIKINLDKKLPFDVYEIPCVKFCAERAWISIPGIVSSIEQISEIDKTSDSKYVFDILPRISTGDTVVFPKNNVEKCGNVITVASSREQAICSCEKKISSILIRLKSNNPMTEKFFSECIHPAFILNDENSSKFYEYCETTCEKIEINKNIFDIIPDFLISDLDILKDWNYRTLRQTLDLYEKYKPKNSSVKISIGKLWKSCILGGIQGMLYYVDSVTDIVS